LYTTNPNNADYSTQSTADTMLSDSIFLVH